MLPERIRVAVPDDIDDILRLVRDLADYERDLASVENTPELVEKALFGPDPLASALVAVVDGDVVGVAVWYRTYSTWTGVGGIHLEDLYVEPGHRGSGLGRDLLAALARIAVAHGYPRLEWVVLDWNTPSIEFYTSLGARPMEDWTTFRLSGEGLDSLAK
ncbi:GNAT family N-acetyltransferase [Nocardioides panacisoli]|uniref:GNAT family N-acetyltransferase n=1 Tax=Nocardioides panacisoli TaxID=627624 RepID=A0ABP7ISM2_9ACTN